MSALSAPLPMRTTAAWGGFSDVRIIPHRYGQVSGGLIQYDAGGRVWCWADHACLGIDAVTADGLPVSNWQWRNDIDSNGHAVALVEFDQGQAARANLVATGRGKPHPVTGAVMDSPADVVWDVLANIAGADYARSRLDTFHKDTLARGLAVGGSIDAAESAQTVARSIAACVGAIFSADARGLCQLLAADSTAPERANIGTNCPASAQAGIDQLINDVVLQFDMLDGSPRQSLRMRAPASIQRYGLLAQSIAVPWLQSPRVAFDVAKRLLQQSARPQWRITATVPRADVRIGDTVTIDHPICPLAGKFVVQARSLDLATGAVVVDGVCAIGALPSVELVSQAESFAPQQITVSSTATATARTITLTESGGAPLANAQVTLDGKITRSADQAGRVTFPATYMTPGEHTLDIITADGRAISQTLLVS